MPRRKIGSFKMADLYSNTHVPIGLVRMPGNKGSQTPLLLLYVFAMQKKNKQTELWRSIAQLFFGRHLVDDWGGI